ncbi:MAG: peptidase [Proteobacteria bacterium]|nr:peptidase [Pseudomonadota bacterium]
MFPSGVAWGIVLFIVLIIAALGWVGLRYFCLPFPIDSECLPEQPATRSPRYVFRGISSWHDQLQKSWRLWLAPLLILVALGAGIYLTLSLADYHGASRLNLYELNGQQHIRQAFVQEALAPPPALPPALFTSTERVDLAGADRDWNKLDPVFTQQVLQLFRRMEERGYPLALLEGYRGAERQDMLAAKGSAVTQVGGQQSKHQYGLAVDVAPVRNGVLVISEKDAWAATAYALLGEEAEHLGLTWGGHWSFRDYGHIEIKGSLSSQLKMQATRNYTTH